MIFQLLKNKKILTIFKINSFKNQKLKFQKVLKGKLFNF